MGFALQLSTIRRTFGAVSSPIPGISTGPPASVAGGRGAGGGVGTAVGGMAVGARRRAVGRGVGAAAVGVASSRMCGAITISSALSERVGTAVAAAGGGEGA